MGRFFALTCMMVAMSPLMALADSLVATRTIRAQTRIAAQDVTLVAAAIPGAVEDAEMAVGQETRVAIYAGRPILAEAIGPAAIIDRNQPVVLVFGMGGLTITAEGRSLGRGGVGDRVQVMNLASRSTVFGQITADGTVRVEP
jgi:flagellar basal body P-ring formation protein FlgA